MNGVIYTETTVYSPPAAFASDAPYQIAIVTLDDGQRVTARIVGEPVHIGDAVHLTRDQDGILYFSRISHP